MVHWSHLQRFVKPELWICNDGEGKEQLIVGSFLAESPRLPGTNLGERSGLTALCKIRIVTICNDGEGKELLIVISCLAESPRLPSISLHRTLFDFNNL
ncbi:hypothetical protein AYI85_05530 [Shewanella algae]|nr:hypothetical protein AYI85_05530 [Shewanella algae]TVL00068.1 hypothetical protein AYI84_17890 [Shewanella algae]TVL51195.1 hypothetical protein AYI99_15250 [Shewanella algae]